MQIATRRLVLRPWQSGDEDALVAAANHREVWINLTDDFPHPYTPSAAKAWIQRVEADTSGLPGLAITVAGTPVGGIGVVRLGDLSRFTGVLGYWLAPTAWGSGYATEAACALTEHVFVATDLERIEARVLQWNPRSRRVLEKAGFQLDARLERSVHKDGQLIDEWLYSRLRSAAPPLR